jgi:hypothetical protein
VRFAHVGKFFKQERNDEYSMDVGRKHGSGVDGWMWRRRRR